MANLEQQVEESLSKLGDEELNKLALHLNVPKANEGIQAPLGVRIRAQQRKNFVKWVKETGNIQKAGIYLGIMPDSKLPTIDKEVKSAQKLEHSQIATQKGEQDERYSFEKPPELIRKIAWVRKHWREYWKLLLIAGIILGAVFWLSKMVSFRNKEDYNRIDKNKDAESSRKVPSDEAHNTSDLSNIYCPLSSEIRKEMVINMRRIRNKFRNLDIKISTTSDKGNRVRQRVAEEIAGILTSAGFEAKVTKPIIRFSSDTSDVVIKMNASDVELVTQLSGILKRFIQTNTPFSAMSNANLQKGELQIIIAGDPLFSSDGIVTFQ